jgi:DNA-directed RNA polymerase I, II, and III subunit RPABC2
MPFITKYEKARIIGLRAQHLNDGVEPLIKGDYDNITLAEMEVQQKLVPFIIRRLLPNGEFEYWNINDLEIF